jgi:hypothetical protein
MAGEFPHDLQATVQADVTRILQLLKEAGWSVDPIYWEPNWDRTSERRVCFSAISRTGKRILSTCPEKSLPERLMVLLRSKS